MEEPTALKIFYLVPKMLKSPTKWRPISRPPFAPLTALSVNMTSILNAIQDSTDTIWQNFVQSALGWNIGRCQIFSGARNSPNIWRGWLKIRSPRTSKRRKVTPAFSAVKFCRPMVQ